MTNGHIYCAIYNPVQYILLQVELGNMGNEDENIQLEVVRAAEGNVPSMITMGDINYFGARGVARDQPEALRYYEQAAAAQDPYGEYAYI